jgi:hypothetical protein
MPPQICDKCNKPSEKLLRLEMGTSFATARCCPQCYERIFGKEAMEEAMKALETGKFGEPEA